MVNFSIVHTYMLMEYDVYERVRTIVQDLSASAYSKGYVLCALVRLRQVEH